MAWATCPWLHLHALCLGVRLHCVHEGAVTPARAASIEPCIVAAAVADEVVTG